MILLDDVILPEPYDTPAHLCLSSYRYGRKAALKALAHLNTLVDKIEQQADAHDRDYPGRQMPTLQQLELHRRLHFAGESARFYRQRLKFLRTYRRYVEAVHGPS